MWILSYVVDGVQHQFAATHEECLKQRDRLRRKYGSWLTQINLQSAVPPFTPKGTDEVPAQLFSYPFPVYTHDVVMDHLRVSFCPSEVSLRDYFAIHAPEPTKEQLVEELMNDATYDISRHHLDKLADLRYAYADAMMKRRQR